MFEYKESDIIDNGQYLDEYGDNACLLCTINSYLKKKKKNSLSWNEFKNIGKNTECPKEGNMINADVYQNFLHEIAIHLKIKIKIYASIIPGIISNYSVTIGIDKEIINILLINTNHFVLLNVDPEKLKYISIEEYKIKYEKYIEENSKKEDKIVVQDFSTKQKEIVDKDTSIKNRTAINSIVDALNKIKEYQSI